MSRRTNPTLIGAFVLGAVALGVAGVLVLSGGGLLEKRHKLVMYFEGSVKGLSVGSPVMFRGVKMGSVTDIDIVLDTETMDARIPVIAEFDSRSIERIGIKLEKGSALLDDMIAFGLRARLELQSLLTGQLVIQLDFFPDKPAELVGGRTGYPELPTVPTPLQEIERKLENLNIENVVQDVSDAMRGINRLVNAPEIMELLRSMDRTIDDVGALARNVDDEVKPVSADLARTLADARGALGSAQRALDNADLLVVNADESLRRVGTAAEDALGRMGTAADTADRTLVSAGDVLADDSPVMYELVIALRELAGTARSLRALAETLERHPEALLRGKNAKGGD